MTLFLHRFFFIFGCVILCTCILFFSSGVSVPFFKLPSSLCCNEKSHSRAHCYLLDSNDIQRKSCTISSVHHQSNQSASRKANFVFAVHNHHNTQYTLNIALGHPPQMLTLLVDTGSSHLWILDDRHRLARGAAPFKSLRATCSFHPAHSTSIQVSNRPVESSFGSGTSIFGKEANDWIKFDSTPAQFFQKFALATHAIGTGYDFTNQRFCGILGLAPSDKSFELHNHRIKSSEDVSTQLKTTSIIDSILLSLSIHSFSIYYSQYPRQDSALLLGDPNLMYFEDPLVYVPVVHPSRWQVALYGVAIELDDYHHLISCADESKCEMLIDSGSSLILGPTDAISRFIQLVHIDPTCNNLNSLPSISLRLQNDVRLVLEPSDYVIRVRSHQFTFQCTSSLSAHQNEFLQSTWIMGDVFLRKFFTTFDLRHRRVGFAVAKRLLS